MKTLISILLFLLIYLQYQVWFDKGGYQELQTLQHLVEVQRQENQRLKTRNNNLSVEVTDLKKTLDALEEQARLELGMIKPNEIFYQIIE